MVSRRTNALLIGFFFVIRFSPFLSFSYFIFAHKMPLPVDHSSREGAQIPCKFLKHCFLVYQGWQQKPLPVRDGQNRSLLRCCASRRCICSRNKFVNCFLHICPCPNLLQHIPPCGTCFCPSANNLIVVAHKWDKFGIFCH